MKSYYKRIVRLMCFVIFYVVRLKITYVHKRMNSFYIIFLNVGLQLSLLVPTTLCSIEVTKGNVKLDKRFQNVQSNIYIYTGTYTQRQR